MLFGAPVLRRRLERFVQAAAFVEPLLLAIIVVLFLLRRAAAAAALLGGLRRRRGSGRGAGRRLRSRPSASTAVAGAALLILAALIAAALLAYLRLLAKAHSPALAEARLQALQARIRPHFLFNSLNAVLALIRARPAARRAHAGGSRGPVPRADVRRPQARAPRRRDRAARALRRASSSCAWASGCACPGRSTRARGCAAAAAACCSRCSRTRSTTASSRAPASATCWCASSGAATGCSRASRTRCSRPRPQRAGNHMALENIRERLMLFFDAEARLDTQVTAGRYCVEIDIPYTVALAQAGDAHELRVFIADDEAARARAPEGAARRHRAPSCRTSVVGEARHGLDAIERLPGERRPGLLLDIQMPGMGGIEVARHLARAGAGAGDRVRHRARPPRGRGLRAERARLPAEAGARRAPRRGAEEGFRRCRSRARKLRARPRTAPREYLSVAERNRIVLVPVRDVLFLQAELKYVTLRTRAAST